MHVTLGQRLYSKSNKTHMRLQQFWLLCFKANNAFFCTLSEKLCCSEKQKEDNLCNKGL